MNAILNENEKLDTIIVAFFDSSTTNLVDNLNEEANNLINIDSYATKETILETTKERLLWAKEAILEITKERLL